MSQIKIKDLPEKIDNPMDEDLLVIEDSEDTKKIPLIKLRASFSMDGILNSIKDMLVDKIDTFITTHDDRYKELEERNKQLEVISHNLENDHIHDMERIAVLDNKVIDQYNEITKLKSENTRLTESLMLIKLLNDSLTGQAEDIEDLITNIESTIYNLSTRYNNLEIEYNKLQKENEAIKNTIANLENKSNTTIDNFVNQANLELETKMNELMEYIKHYHPDVEV